MGPPVFTYKEVVDFIERDGISSIKNFNYDRELFIEFLKTPMAQDYIDKYFEDITDEVLLSYLENEIYDDNLISRIEKCVSLSKSKKKSITELKLSFIYLNSNFYKKNGLLNKIKKIVNQYKKK